MNISNKKVKQKSSPFPLPRLELPLLYAVNDRGRLSISPLRNGPAGTLLDELAEVEGEDGGRGGVELQRAPVSLSHGHQAHEEPARGDEGVEVSGRSALPVRADSLHHEDGAGDDVAHATDAVKESARSLLHGSIDQVKVKNM